MKLFRSVTFPVKANQGR